MTHQTKSRLEHMLRECKLGWMIDSYAPPEQAVPFLHRALAEASAWSQQQPTTQALQFDEDVLAGEYEANPHKVTAFFQALGTTKTPQMLVMVWRILQGMDIVSVELSYQARNRFGLRVVLGSPYDENTEEYESSNIDDAALLRHFGITRIDGAPLFDGFYPLRLS